MYFGTWRLECTLAFYILFSGPHTRAYTCRYLHMKAAPEYVPIYIFVIY